MERTNVLMVTSALITGILYFPAKLLTLSHPLHVKSMTIDIPLSATAQTEKKKWRLRFFFVREEGWGVREGSKPEMKVK